MRHAVRMLAVALLLAAAGACGPREQQVGYRQNSESYTFRVTSDPQPPHAREPIYYKVVVLDRSTGQPIEEGEGQIFAQNRQGKKTWDSFVAAPEVGTYTAKLSYLTAGDWAVGIRFRRDSTAPLERIDWMQDVKNDRNPIP